MNIVDIIIKKKNKESLNEMEINYVIREYVNGNIKDYQMSSLLMAICLNGMNEEETINLTTAMLKSGETIDLSETSGIKVDKHSTGGVGDKTTLIVLPIVASCNVKVSKMSGRALGYTGGTIDKLESIPGFKTNIELEQMIKETNSIGMSIASQTQNLVPADKLIYALRDVTGTVDNISLVASSIMSKKLASGSDAIILDVKAGKASLMHSYEESKKLAELMVKIGNKFNKKTVAILSNMNEPLGYSIGNSVEIEEVIETLKGNGEERLVELCITIASYMISIAKNISIEDAKKEAIEVLNNGKAYNKFIEFITLKNGSIEQLPQATTTDLITSEKEGYITEIDPIYLANILTKLGAGRMSKEDKIDHSVGIILSKKVGDYVKVGDVIAVIRHNKDIKTSNVETAFTISNTKKEQDPIIYEIIE